ncbi:MAG TPA: glycoside hydrolase family 15 protein, partial [Solirubrobacteraceae bacterium]|nr:glycoside hydrolase family 15 protein [Solirubrobacteraceae bacterium]
MIDLSAGKRHHPPRPDRALRPFPRGDAFLPIEDYAAIGDGHTLALVGADGAIDWMCLPELDSPSVFGALLDAARGGRFTLCPAVPFTTSRRYLERTNVLETTFHTERGKVRLLDALTIDKSQTVPWRELVRRLEVLGGSTPMRWRCEPRFGYGSRPARFERRGAAMLARHDHLQLGLRVWGVGEPQIRDGFVDGGFELNAGEQAMLVLVAGADQPLPVPEREGVERRLDDAIEIWRSWVGRHRYEGPWRDAVERSLLAIKLLAHSDTGAIAAAGTTSLPEAIGGQRNYDYRFGWVRDLCFALDALIAVGMGELTQAAVAWLLAATGRTHPRIDPVYTLRGEVLRSQQRLPLSGYGGTGPVHLGNDAGAQLQLGGFGDLVETVAAFAAHGHILPVAIGERLADVGDLLSRIWRSEDAGLWELGERRQYGTSKLGCWVAFERLLQLVDAGQVPPRHVARWQRERDEVRRFIELHLFSPQRNSYLFRAGSGDLDCAMLLAARRGFGDRARLLGTVDAIRS